MYTRDIRNTLLTSEAVHLSMIDKKVDFDLALFHYISLKLIQVLVYLVKGFGCLHADVTLF